MHLGFFLLDSRTSYLVNPGASYGTNDLLVAIILVAVESSREILKR
jgi:hypothetical protein